MAKDRPKCYVCLEPMDQTPSGFWTCPEHTGLLSNKAAVEKYCQAMAPQWERERQERRDELAKLPLASNIAGTNLYDIAGMDGLYRRVRQSRAELFALACNGTRRVKIIFLRRARRI